MLNPLRRTVGGRLQHVRRLQGKTIGIPKESTKGEKRVVITPDNAAQLVKKGASVRVAAGAGSQSGYIDDLFLAAGATISNDEDEVWKSDMVFKLNTPSAEEGKRGVACCAWG
jgi:alanine dehydrogenase